MFLPGSAWPPPLPLPHPTVNKTHASAIVERRIQLGIDRRYRVPQSAREQVTTGFGLSGLVWRSEP
jgi:hypothetical protein